MIKILAARWRQGNRTLRQRVDTLQLPDRFRGKPILSPERCGAGCEACAASCPTGAISAAPLTLDMGRCVFCGLCEGACPTGAIRFSSDHRLAATHRTALRLDGQERERILTLGAELRRLFGRSLRLRQVSAGGCNGCEKELVATGNVVFDASRFGIQFVASPRHADGIVITGPVSRNMEAALRTTYAAVPKPTLVIAVGACAISGGVFAESPETCRGVPSDIPVDLYVPGCPPHPLVFLEGVLRLLGRL